jgi:molybdopterin converting factor small subunit
LLTVVDERVQEDLVGRFQSEAGESDPHVATIRRMSEQVLTAIESSAARQARAWQEAIGETHQQWADVSTSAGRIINESLSAALRENLAHLGRQLQESTLRHAEALGHNSTDTVSKLRQGLERLAELLVEALHKHGEVMSLNEREISEENRRHLSEVEAALGEAMVVASDRQENLIRRSEDLLKEMQIALVAAAEATIRHQEQLVRQSDVLLRVVDSTGQVKVLEESLNDNLAALARVHRFDEMASNLTAAIQVLCARVDAMPAKSFSTLESLGKHSTPHAA